MPSTLRLLVPFALLLSLTACGSVPHAELRITSEPAGARVFLSRRGQQKLQAKIGFIKSNMKSGAFEEEFQLIGTTPLEYSTPLQETSTDATLLGVGGKSLKFFEEGLLRFEREGYETAEKFVRFEKGSNSLAAVLVPTGE
jgi:hypothetical protein